MTINLSGLITGIIATGALITAAVRDHIILWHVKKKVESFDKITEKFQKQLGRTKDEIMDKVDQIGKATAKVEGALATILEFITINNKEKK